MSLHPFQAIVTRYIGPTHFKGGRIKAATYGGTLTVPYDHKLNSEANHAAAAKALAVKLGWCGHWFMGAMHNDTGYCFVCAEGYADVAFDIAGRE
jgi:hypothetical protein